MFLAKKKKRAKALSLLSTTHTSLFYNRKHSILKSNWQSAKLLREYFLSLASFFLREDVSIKKQRNNRKPIWKVNDELCREWSGCIIVTKCLFLHIASCLRNQNICQITRHIKSIDLNAKNVDGWTASLGRPSACLAPL